MGIIVADEIKSKESGQLITAAYICMSNLSLRIMRPNMSENKFNVLCRFNVYYNKARRDEGAKPVDNFVIEITEIPSSEAFNDPSALLYNELKKCYDASNITESI